MIGKIDPVWLRNFILSVVKPLKSGKIVKNSDDNASMDNLYPDGYSDKFKLAQPFGLVSSVPKGVTGFYNSLFGSGHESIILGLLHKLRPNPTGVGETVLYSTTPDGKTIKVKISLKNDGSLVIDAPTTVTVNATTSATVTAPTVTVNASTKTDINSPLVELGDGTLEKVLNGETFLNLFKNHRHTGNLGYPTSAPIDAIVDANQLSQKVKAAK